MMGRVSEASTYGGTRSGHGRVRRPAAIGSVMVVVVSFFIVLSAGVAFAHHPILSGETSCNPDGTWNVTWTVQNSESSSARYMLVRSDSVSAGSIAGVNANASYAGVVNASHPDGTEGGGTIVAPGGQVSPTTSNLAHDVESVTLNLTGFWRYPTGPDTFNTVTTAAAPATVDRPADCTVPSSTVTVIHNATHQVVTSVSQGTTVHDQATVSGSAGTPTGTVTFKWFTNGSCTGDAAATSSPVTLVSGVADASAFAQTPNVSGTYGFQATYAGDSTYDGSTGACEPLVVTGPSVSPPASQVGGVTATRTPGATTAATAVAVSPRFTG
jgi:Bacterial Ig-like domain (group 3)